MIARLDHLRKHGVFGPLTGLTVTAFDEPAAEVVPALEAAHRKRLERPDGGRAAEATTSTGRPPTNCC